MNETGSPVLAAHYGQMIRLTINPNNRRAGGVDWQAGAVKDWCEMPSESLWELISDLEDKLMSIGASSQFSHFEDRQRALHLLIPCLRRGGHWPRSKK